MKCPSCNTENPVDAVFCRNCGQQIKQISTHKSSKENKGGNKKTGCWVFFFLGTLIGIIAFLIYNSIYNSYNDNRAPAVVIESTDTIENDESGDYINIDQNELYFDASDGAKTIMVDASASFSISSDLSSWGHTTIEDNEIRIWLDDNESESSRDDWFEITCGSQTKRVDVHQNGNPYAQTAEIENIWVDHNEDDEYGRVGMKIHIKFKTHNLKDVNCRTVAYFYLEDGSKMIDENDEYRAVDGHVCVGKNFIPPYDNTTFHDLSVFIPYSEFHLRNSSSCYFTIDIRNKDNDKLILHSDQKTTFNYTVN